MNREWIVGRDLAPQTVANICQAFSLGNTDLVDAGSLKTFILNDSGMAKLMARPAGVGLVVALDELPKRELAEAWVLYNKERKFTITSGCSPLQLLSAAAFETVMNRFIQFEHEAGQPIPGTAEDEY